MTDRLVPPAVSDEWLTYASERLTRRPVIEMRGLGVRFGGARHDGLKAGVRAALGRPHPREVWALRNVTLSVRAGECVAVIGANGAGKSTLLRVVAHLIDPDAGTLLVRGRMSALLNLGVGFDPLLTGRENVRLVGSLMGLDHRQTRERLAGVIDFADIGDAIDAPLRTYSAGMRARLGFAAAANMIEPHILVLDEVMGTGDAAFRERSRERVMELVRHAHAVIVASHDMAWVCEHANYALLLDGGSVVAEGAPSGVTTLHRARAVKPPRLFGCDRCLGAATEGYCHRCGVLRRDQLSSEQ